MKEKIKKIASVCKVIFGYGIMITVLVGGLTFLGYVAALIIGGETAALICDFLYKKVFTVLIYVSTSMVLFGLLTMYLAGEFALTVSKKKSSKEESER